MGSLKACLPKKPKTHSRLETYQIIGEYVMDELQEATNLEIIGNSFSKRDLAMIKAIVKVRLHVNPCPAFVVGTYSDSEPQFVEWEIG